MDTIFDIAERAENFNVETPSVQEVREFYKEVKAIVVAAFGKQFTFDELNEGVEIDELMKVFKDLSKNVMSGMKKTKPGGSAKGRFPGQLSHYDSESQI